jgi:hypothetical protein
VAFVKFKPQRGDILSVPGMIFNLKGKVSKETKSLTSPPMGIGKLTARVSSVRKNLKEAQGI